MSTDVPADAAVAAAAPAAPAATQPALGPLTLPTSLPVNVDVSPDAIESAVGQFLTWPGQWPGLADVLRWCQEMSPGTACILSAAGVVYLTYGHSAHRLLVSLNGAVLGAWVGGMAGKAGGSILPGMLIGGFVGGAAAWPLVRYAISLCGAIVGFALGASVWRSLGNLDPSYAWAGGAIGFVFLFMLSFITARWAVILSTGLQGSAMLAFGVLGLLYKYPSLAGRLDTTLSSHAYILPIAVFVPAILGWIYQQQSAVQPPAGPQKRH